MPRHPIRSLTAPLRGLALVLGLAALGVTTPALAQTPAADPKARALLDEVAQAYRALPAYGDAGEFVLALKINGKPSTVKQAASITLVRPDRLRIDTGVASLVCDGKTLTSLVTPARRYSTEPAPKSIALHTVTDGPVGSLLLGGPSGPPLSMVLGLLLADDPARAVLDQGETLTMEPDRDLDGRKCQVLRVDSASGTSYRLLIDPKSRLLRAITVAPDEKAIRSAFPTGTSIEVESYRWTAGPVSVTPRETAFAVEIPRGFTRFGEVARAPDAAAPKFKVQGLVGKPSPGFTMTLLDGAGKTRTVGRDDLAGKIVVIDFWATWCGPCMAELPEVQKLIEGCVKAKKAVVVVALSQDSDPKDPAEVRKLIESTLKAKSIDLTAAPVGKIGLDPSNSVGEVFQVEGYPTVVVIDAKGVVRSAHVGFSPDVGKTLAAEVDALLEGKPLPEAGPAK